MSPRPKAEVPLVRKIAQAFAAVGKLHARWHQQKAPLQLDPRHGCA